MYPKEDGNIERISFGKALGLTLFVIAIGMTEKAFYEIKNFLKKHLPH